MALVSGSFFDGGGHYPALEGPGGQWLDLVGDVTGSQSGVEKTIPTIIGQTYKIAFHIGNVFRPGSPFGTTSRVNVLADGALVYGGSNTEGGGSSLINWALHDFVFTATETFTTFRFANADGFGDNVNGLDGVVISTVSAAIPEPATWAMMLMGFVGLGYAARRRREDAGARAGS